MHVAPLGLGFLVLQLLLAVENPWVTTVVTCPPPKTGAPANLVPLAALQGLQGWAAWVPGVRSLLSHFIFPSHLLCHKKERERKRERGRERKERRKGERKEGRKEKRREGR